MSGNKTAGIRLAAAPADELQRLALWIARRTVQGEDGCWYLENRSRARHQGILFVDGRTIGLHQVVFYLLHRESPPNVCHHCDHGACFRPQHLFGGTMSDNLRDAIRKGRHKHPVNPRAILNLGPQRRGEDSPSSKLTLVEVQAIKRAFGSVSDAELARRYGVRRESIRDIRNGRNWAHVTA